MTSKQFYVNGEQVSAAVAEQAFVQMHKGHGSESAEIADMWEQCQFSEEARDYWMGDAIEIVG